MARRALVVLCTLSVMFILLAAPGAWAQQTQGTVTVTVVDPSGAVVTGAQLKLTDLATNDTRQATTREAGNYTFVNLNFGNYKLTVLKEGFETQSYGVVVQSARNTDVKAEMKVGVTTTVVEVEGGIAPLVQTTTNAINNTIDLKQIEDLPLGGRNIEQLSTLGAGYNGAFNGLPIMAQGNTVDGILANTGRWKYGTTGYITPGVTARLENIAEMTVSTDQLDLNSGWGTSGMQVTYVTRRGSNQWHGRFFEDHWNSALNAAPWGGPKSKRHLNEFGGSVGGPILKDKLFFFANFSEYNRPGYSSVTRQYFRDPAKTGVFTYGSGVTVNLFNVISAYNAAHATNFPVVLNQVVSDRIKQVDAWRTSSGAPVAASSAPSDPNVNAWTFQNPTPIQRYYPTVRIDYNISESKRLNFSLNQTKTSNPTANADHWPGDGRAADNKTNGFTSALGFEWTVSPTLINQARFGYLYTASWFGINGPTDFRDPGATETWFGYAGGTTNGNLDDWYELPNSRMQPVFSLSDNLTWAKGAHTFNFGINAYRDQNRYWDPEEGYTQINLGLNTLDPVSNVLSKSAIQALSSSPTAAMSDAEWTNAKQLYATLTGRISSYYGRHALNPSTGQFYTRVDHNILNELQKSWGLFFQDSYKMKRNLTVNYGLRWDFVYPDKDLTNKYFTLATQDIWGPTAIGALFQPGAATLTGTMNPQWRVTPQAYNGWNVTPQPALGIAWTPRSGGTLLEKLMGGEKTVIRAGYSVRRFTEPQQFVWDFGTNYGTGFYQRFFSNPDVANGPGTFVAGSMKLGDPIPTNTFTTAPPTFQTSIPMSASTFGSLTVNSIQPGIRQPYTQSVNFGFQRELGASRALEVRYNGNRTIHQWIAPNINEVNIFENGFLNEFKQAQVNYAANHAAGVESYANRNLPGQANLPILTAAGLGAGTNTTFLNYVINGQAGDAAWRIQRTRSYFCALVGSAAFSPCGPGIAGAGYPINFFVPNPFAVSSGGGGSAQILTDQGYSNYNALQVEFRQRSWHGATVNANYTWSRTLGISATDWYAGFSQFTLRDLRSSYGPLMDDRNHVIHVSSTYDLPVGKGKQFLNMGGVVDKVLGGWTVSTIVTFQTGRSFRIGGTYDTVNNVRDGGLVLNGITAKELQDRVGLYFNAAGQPYFLDPQAMTWTNANGGKATFQGGATLTSFNTPGEWGSNVYFHGPHQTFTDIGISKSIPFTERVKFKFQTEMTNAFNHPTFDRSNFDITSTGFGRASQTASPRNIEFRANVEF